jgi:hypothetical protein
VRQAVPNGFGSSWRASRSYALPADPNSRLRLPFRQSPASLERPASLPFLPPLPCEQLPGRTVLPPSPAPLVSASEIDQTRVSPQGAMSFWASEGKRPVQVLLAGLAGVGGARQRRANGSGAGRRAPQCAMWEPVRRPVLVRRDGPPPGSGRHDSPPRTPQKIAKTVPATFSAPAG